MRFEWDPNKNEINKEKHDLSFEEATELLEVGTDYIEIYDEEHSGDEDRFIAIGPIRMGVIVVIYTERQDDVVRIISTRKATKSEAKLFREYSGETDE